MLFCGTYTSAPAPTRKTHPNNPRATKLIPQTGSGFTQTFISIQATRKLESVCRQSSFLIVLFSFSRVVYTHIKFVFKPKNILKNTKSIHDEEPRRERRKKRRSTSIQHRQHPFGCKKRPTRNGTQAPAPEFINKPTLATTTTTTPQQPTAPGKLANSIHDLPQLHSKPVGGRHLGSVVNSWQGGRQPIIAIPS